jgi:hypothetical protein
MSDIWVDRISSRIVILSTPVLHSSTFAQEHSKSRIESVTKSSNLLFDIFVFVFHIILLCELHDEKD